MSAESLHCAHPSSPLLIFVTWAFDSELCPPTDPPTTPWDVVHQPRAFSFLRALDLRRTESTDGLSAQTPLLIGVGVDLRSKTVLPQTWIDVDNLGIGFTLLSQDWRRARGVPH
jgi:hypothetical protein